MAVREYESVGSSAARCRSRVGALGRLDARVDPARLRPGLAPWRPAGGSARVQDVFVDAKVPRSEREAWPLVVRGDEVVAVPGIVAAPATRMQSRGSGMSSVNELTAAVSEILIDEDTLQGRIAELGSEISDDYRGRDLLVGVLKGAVFFMADLMRRIEIPCEVDFMAISSYGAGVDSSGVVRILRTSTCPSRGATCSSSRTSSTPG